jgi:hypothetical protein
MSCWFPTGGVFDDPARRDNADAEILKEAWSNADRAEMMLLVWSDLQPLLGILVTR